MENGPQNWATGNNLMKSFSRKCPNLIKLAGKILYISILFSKKARKELQEK